MPDPELMLIALALSADAFAVGLAVGIRHRKPRQLFRLSFHFGLFQALFPLAGALAGATIGALVTPWDHLLASALLLGIGAKMIAGYFKKDDDRPRSDPTRGLTMVMLSAAVSIDALAVGCSLGLCEVSIAPAVITIGITTTVCTLIGMLLAGRIRGGLGARAELVAGAVLIALAAKNAIQNVVGTW